MEFKEHHYKKLFEWKYDNELINKNELAENANSVYQQKNEYTYRDFLEFYEELRFSQAFIAYKMMDWWPLIDTLATYSHIFSNLAIIIIAIYISVSVFMGFNVVCVCTFYILAVYQLNKKAEQNYDVSGIQG